MMGSQFAPAFGGFMNDQTAQMGLQVGQKAFQVGQEAMEQSVSSFPIVLHFSPARINLVFIRQEDE